MKNNSKKTLLKSGIIALGLATSFNAFADRSWKMTDDLILEKSDGMMFNGEGRYSNENRYPSDNRFPDLNTNFNTNTYPDVNRYPDTNTYPDVNRYPDTNRYPDAIPYSNEDSHLKIDRYRDGSRYTDTGFSSTLPITKLYKLDTEELCTSIGEEEWSDTTYSKAKYSCAPFSSLSKDTKDHVDHLKDIHKDDYPIMSPHQRRPYYPHQHRK